MPTRVGAKPAMTEVEQYYQDRSNAARMWKSRGKKIIGYLCCFVPVEFFTALDFIPYRIQGNIHEPVGKADACLETISCPYVRSCFDLSLQGKYDFLDGLVVPHSCDTVQRIYDIWRAYREPRFHHFLNVPHMVQPSSNEFFKKELESLASGLEEFSGQKLTVERLRQAIRLHNHNRSLLRALYELRKQDPPLIPGADVLKLIVAGMGMPVEQFNGLIQRVIEEAKTGVLKPGPSSARIMVYGSEIDDISFVEAIEASGANVVVDDICTGTRSFWEDVDESIDPWDGLSDRYLRGIHCPRTCRPQGKDRKDDLENRLGHLRVFARDFNVNGAILDIMRFCDTHELEAPDVKEYLEGLGIPSLYLEDDYTAGGVGQLRTRIQAFLEMIG